MPFPQDGQGFQRPTVFRGHSPWKLPQPASLSAFTDVQFARPARDVTNPGKDRRGNRRPGKAWVIPAGSNQITKVVL
jgi:hypothetical protein